MSKYEHLGRGADQNASVASRGGDRIQDHPPKEITATVSKASQKQVNAALSANRQNMTMTA